ncbi:MULTISPECIES: DUF481 domain-containing protein [Modicisalibacter]|uniref:DUF481 domain-containing protein n=1 Tax=Modicisalibacter TaxID=574347 RepID=UPI00100C2616|nr:MULTISPECIES: DUF481 domain-containing protein [Halomonadaceae]MBZ9559413.1 DUF481 domain-containing protein [Modicisalibacter sp. R2A 31.J]MBZ9576421.1 DUF481 domain-containing protein [Modicisalibacter sp. MOD 31.J]
MSRLTWPRTASRRCAALALLGLTLSPPSPAQDSLFYAPPQPGDDAPEFSGQAELGYTHLAGNTDSETLIAKGRLTWITDDKWTHTLRGETRQVKEDDSASAEQYLVAGRERYELEGPHYLFGFTRWEKDRFSGYDYQFTTIIGYGRQLLAGPTHTLSLEAGPGYRHDELESGSDDDLAVGYGALDYQWQFNEGSSFEQELSVEGTDTNVTTRSFSAITAQLNAHLALRLSHEIKNNSNPPEGTESDTDLTTAASLLYRW